MPYRKSTFSNAAPTFNYSPPPPRGLIVSNPGGFMGWVARRFLPRTSTRVYLAYIRLSRSHETRRLVKGLKERMPAAPWFTHVEIETLNRCNGACSFCPVNRASDTRTYMQMSEEFFTDLLAQLSDVGYSGYLGLFSNNEPLLDKRIANFASKARAALPRAYVAISTNGILLDIELLQTLLPHIDRLVINNYNDSPRMHDHVRRIHDFCLTCEGQWLLQGKTVEISLRGQDDVLASRGGNAPNRNPPPNPLAIPCLLPFYQLVVRPDGKVSLCCNDALGEMTLGDLSKQSMADVWFGNDFVEVRKSMAEQGRSGLPMCRRCDFVKHTTRFNE